MFPLWQCEKYSHTSTSVVFVPLCTLILSKILTVLAIRSRNPLFSFSVKCRQRVGPTTEKNYFVVTKRNMNEWFPCRVCKNVLNANFCCYFLSSLSHCSSLSFPLVIAAVGMHMKIHTLDHVHLFVNKMRLFTYEIISSSI